MLRGGCRRGRAEDGNTAVSIFAATPDAVVLDMMLPGRSGFLVEKIKGRASSRGDGESERGRRHLEFFKGLGVSAYLVKPVSLTRLMDVLGDLLSSPNA